MIRYDMILFAQIAAKGRITSVYMREEKKITIKKKIEQ